MYAAHSSRKSGNMGHPLAFYSDPHIREVVTVKEYAHSRDRDILISVFRFQQSSMISTVTACFNCKEQ